MIGLVDYGVGNLRSVLNGLDYVGAPARVISTPAGLCGIDKILLPGVGAFGAAMERLNRLGFVEALTEAVQGRRTPVLGVCLGMQLLFARGSESGDQDGLGFIAGSVERIDVGETGLRVPHVGWNELERISDCPLLRGLEETPSCYFVHSYSAHPCASDAVSAVCDYGSAVVAGVSSGNVFGLQFHPEKSQAAGLRMLRNFADL